MAGYMGYGLKNRRIFKLRKYLNNMGINHIIVKKLRCCGLRNVESCGKKIIEKESGRTIIYRAIVKTA